MSIRDAGFADALKGWDDKVKRLTEAVTVFLYEAESNAGHKLANEDFDRLFENVVNPDARNGMNTIFDEIWMKGERKGRRDGKLEGKLEGKCGAISQLLSLKYPNYPREMDATIGKISNLDQLDSLFEFVFSSRSVDEVNKLVSEYLTSSKALA